MASKLSTGEQGNISMLTRCFTRSKQCSWLQVCIFFVTQQCCPPVAKPVRQQQPCWTNCHSFRWKLTITGIWLAEIPRSGDAGTRLLSWTLLRFRRFVETFVPPGDATQYFFSLLFFPQIHTLHNCRLSLLHKVKHSTITWDNVDVPVLQGWLQISAKGLCGREHGRWCQWTKDKQTNKKKQSHLHYYKSWDKTSNCYFSVFFGGGGFCYLRSSFHGSLTACESGCCLLFHFIYSGGAKRVYSLTPRMPNLNPQHK